MKSLILVLLLSSGSFLYAEKGKDVADIYFRSGAVKYAKGDLMGAIGELEEAYRINSESKKIKELLSQFLTEYGIKLYDSGRYKEAEVNFERAVKINPGLEKASQYLKLVESKLTPLEKPGEQIIVSKEESVVSHAVEVPSTLPVKKKEEVMAKQTRIVQPVVLAKPQETQSLPVVTIEKSLTEDKTEPARKKDRSLFIAIGTGVSVALLITLITILIITRSWHKRQSKIESQIEKVLSSQFNADTVLLQGKSHLATSSIHDGRISVAEMLQDSNPRIRAKGVEIMELELSDEEPKIAEELLKPYLNDPHNRVRANAVKALCSHNQEKAKALLQEMINSPDKWMRTSAAWMIGEINHPECGYEMLQPLLNDSDFHVKRRVLKTLEKLRLNQEKTESEKSGDNVLIQVDVVKQKIRTAGYGYINVRVREGNGVGAEKMEQEAVEINELLRSPFPRLRAKGLELIEPDLHKEPPEVVVKLLQPYLEDKNHRVRSVAAKLLYKFNPEQAIKILEEMLSSTNSFFRLAAIWSMENVLAPEEIKNRFQLLVNDPDFHIRKRVMKILHKLENEKNVSEDKKITGKPIPEKVRWVYLDVEHRVLH